jgi:D-cysteine desulfhydrase
VDRVPLARLPTPLEPAPLLSEAWGGPRIWIKRDDLTGFGLSGNKVRKLEFHLGAALDAEADIVITCGALQSNHCRATALACAGLGLDTILYLRTDDGRPPSELAGNHLLQRLAGAECRYITPDEYRARDRLMAEAAADLDHAWVIPEGGSDALGMQGFVTAISELAPQLEAAELSEAVIWHAASSGGTTAGLVRGAADAGVQIIGSSVGDPADALTAKVVELLEVADQRFGTMPRASEWRITDRHVGGGYGITSDEELAVQVEATRLTGLIWDPTYTGKALYGLRREIAAGSFAPGTDIVFWHTGGGFAAFAHDWSRVLDCTQDAHEVLSEEQRNATA